jgi:hypothetical protein
MKYIIATLLILLVAANAFGQTKITVLSYQMSVPDQNLEEYINETSFRGVGFDGRWFAGGSSFTGGISLAWHVFNKSTDGTIEFPNGALTGKQNRYINSFPIMLTGHLYFGNKNRLWMFIGGGVGTYYIIQRFEAGVHSIEESAWHLGAYPEFGLQIPLSEADFFINGKYNYAFEAGESVTGDKLDLAYWTVSVGLAYQGW